MICETVVAVLKKIFYGPATDHAAAISRRVRPSNQRVAYFEGMCLFIQNLITQSPSIRIHFALQPPACMVWSVHWLLPLLSAQSHTPVAALARSCSPAAALFLPSFHRVPFFASSTAFAQPPAAAAAAATSCRHRSSQSGGHIGIVAIFGP
jgi:hypothetical protein